MRGPAIPARGWLAGRPSKSLLQHNVVRQKAPASVLSFEANGTELLQAVAPLKFMHTPKCGSSFSNALAHTPGMCPGLPNTVSLGPSNFGEYFDVHFWQLCPEICDQKMFSCNPPMWKHEAFGGNAINPYRGHLVTMVRDPVQRMAAGSWNPSKIKQGYPRDVRGSLSV
eukprot:g13457.t1